MIITHDDGTTQHVFGDDAQAVLHALAIRRAGNHILEMSKDIVEEYGMLTGGWSPPVEVSIQTAEAGALETFTLMFRRYTALALLLALAGCGRIVGPRELCHDFVPLYATDSVLIGHFSSDFYCEDRR